MATTFTRLTRPRPGATRPRPGADYRARVGHRRLGLGLAALGVVLATVAFIANLVAAGQIGSGVEVGGVLAWSFGLTTTAFGTIKFGIAIILIGILVRMWFRWESMRQTLPALKGAALTEDVQYGPIDTPFGPATVTKAAPESLPIHKMARTMWGPMLAMGAMAVLAGFIVSLVWSGATDPETARQAAAWTQGLQFLGEGLLLAGISFLLGSILGLIRDGGGEVQESVGVPVKLLQMPATAKLFVGLMATGLMVAIAQFVLYAWSTTIDDPAVLAANAVWLGPFREFGLGLLLSGIVLALATIGTALAFQANRVREIITTGR